MQVVRRVVGLTVVLAGIFLVSFLVWGESLETLFSAEACADWFAGARSHAWALAIGLLIGDLLLPIPATGIMTALGAVYGTTLGAVIGAIGSMLAGWTGYGLARLGGKRAARWLADEQELARFHDFFDRWGGLAVILSRAFPILPEVVTLLAGLARMHPGRFALSLALGTIPTATLFAALGAWAREAPAWGTLASLALPVLLYAVVFRVWKRPV